MRVGEETIPALHGHVERLNVGEFRRKTEVKTGKCEQKVGRARGGRASAQPKRDTENAWRVRGASGGWSDWRRRGRSKRDRGKSIERRGG